MFGYLLVTDGKPFHPYLCALDGGLPGDTHSYCHCRLCNFIVNSYSTEGPRVFNPLCRDFMRELLKSVVEGK